MPSHFDDVIPVGRRSEKDVRIHRNIRRKVGPDFLSKELVSSYTPHQNFYEYDLASGWYRQGRLSRTELSRYGIPYAYVNAFPFNIRQFDIRLSLKKKKRWMIGEALKDNIWKYQDDENKLRVSYIRAQASHVRKAYRWEQIDESLPKKDTEVITTSAFGTRHWRNVYTNHADLLRKPMPPKRICGRDNPEYTKLRDYTTHDEQCLHIVYTETVHKISKKEDTKMGGVERYEKKKARRGFIAPNADVRTISTGEHLTEYSETIKFVDDRPVEEDSVRNESRPNCKFCLADFITERRTRSNRKKKLKVNPEYSECSYLPRKASSEDFVSNTDTPAPSKSEWSVESSVEHPPTGKLSYYPDPLPTYTFTLENNAEYERLITLLAAFAKKIERSHPKTFLYVSTGENYPFKWKQFQDFHGFVCFRFAAEGDPSRISPNVVRLTFNSDNSNLPGIAEIPQQLVAPIDLRPILPADCFYSGDFYDENDCQRTAVAKWLEVQNAESSTIPISYYCDVCDGENTDGFSLGCGHFYCSHCWLSYSTLQIESGQAPITCMNTKCECVLEFDHLLTFLPYELCLRYEKLVWEKIVMQKNWLYCENCQRVIHVNIDGTKRRREVFHPAIVCKCGHSHCVQCKRSWHWPLSCNVAERYNDVLENYGEGTSCAVQRIKVSMRRCPWCRSFCERSDGCNHMICRCKHEFCYGCGDAWDDEDHSECDQERMTNMMPLYMVDLVSHPNGDVLHEFITENWELRYLKTPNQRRKLRNDIDWMENEADITAITYLAAHHVMESCEVALFLLKRKMNEKFVVEETRSAYSNDFAVSRSNSQSEFLVNLTKRIRFVLSRLYTAMHNSKDLSRVILLRGLLVRTIKCMFIPHHMVVE
ncbi:hypothetical protein AB6A40_004635 [Gnathostoma spinigerum]|uniref:RBR-type E3 ubiquitin transferase n=1 Tax=Gnathostoma spinigerum TaxID=75299 RepID=A0ABD6EFC7_9BILA